MHFGYKNHLFFIIYLAAAANGERIVSVKLEKPSSSASMNGTIIKKESTEKKRKIPFPTSNGHGFDANQSHSLTARKFIYENQIRFILPFDLINNN